MSFGSSLSNLKAHAHIDGHYYSGRTCIHLLENGGYNARYYDTRVPGWFYNGVEYRFRSTKDGNPANLLQPTCGGIMKLKVSELTIVMMSCFKGWFVTRMELLMKETNKKENGYRSFAAFAATVSSLHLPTTESFMLTAELEAMIL